MKNINRKQGGYKANNLLFNATDALEYQEWPAATASNTQETLPPPILPISLPAFSHFLPTKL